MCRTSCRIGFVKIDDHYGVNDVALIVGDHNTYGKFTLLLELTNDNFTVGKLVQGLDTVSIGRDDMAFVQDVKTALAAYPEHGSKVIESLQKMKRIAELDLENLKRVVEDPKDLG